MTLAIVAFIDRKKNTTYIYFSHYLFPSPPFFFSLNYPDLVPHRSEQNFPASPSLCASPHVPTVATMESDLEQQPQVNSSGLTRYRSAPSSYFSNIIDREFYEHVFNRPSSPETERVFSRFVNSLNSEEEDSLHHKLSTDSSSSAAVKEEVNQQDQGINEEHVAVAALQQSNNNINNYNNNNNNNYSASHNFYQSSSSKPPLPNQNPNLPSAMEQGSFSMGLRHSGNNSNLTRHSSSPAGLFSQINIENGMSCVHFMFIYFLILAARWYNYVVNLEIRKKKKRLIVLGAIRLHVCLELEWVYGLS